MTEEDLNTREQFPYKLHRMLEEAEQKGHADIISWTPDGTAFKVHNKHKFSAELMPKYFSSNKYKTFQRNLNLWCFQTISRGDPDRGAICHQSFVRGNPSKCSEMKRVRIKKKGKMDKAGVPTAASMPFMNPLAIGPGGATMGVQQPFLLNANPQLDMMQLNLLSALNPGNVQNSQNQQQQQPNPQLASMMNQQMQNQLMMMQLFLQMSQQQQMNQQPMPFQATPINPNPLSGSQTQASDVLVPTPLLVPATNSSEASAEPVTVKSDLSKDLSLKPTQQEEI